MKELAGLSTDSFPTFFLAHVLSLKCYCVTISTLCDHAWGEIHYNYCWNISDIFTQSFCMPHCCTYMNQNSRCAWRHPHSLCVSDLPSCTCAVKTRFLMSQFNYKSNNDVVPQLAWWERFIVWTLLLYVTTTTKYQHYNQLSVDTCSTCTLWKS